MPWKLISDKSELESSVQRLVEAAGSPIWRTAGKILFVNSAILAPQSRAGRLALVLPVSEVDIDELDDAHELTKARGDFAVEEMARWFSLRLMPDIINVASKSTSEHAAAAAGLELLRTRSDLSSELDSAVFSAACRGSVLAVGRVLSWVREILEQQHQVVGEDHFEMVEQLAKLGLAEPWLSISMCPACLAYDLSISTFSRSGDTCGACGREWFSAQLMLLRPEFEEVKRENNDLPLFIAAYLRHKVLARTEIWPESHIRGPAGNPVQVDVGVRGLRLGIECKVVEVPRVVSEAKLSSLVGELAVQARRYATVGVRRYWAITNLSEGHAATAQDQLRKALQEDGFEDIRVLPGELDEVLEALEATASELNRQAEMVLERRAARGACAEPDATPQSHGESVVESAGTMPTTAEER